MDGLEIDMFPENPEHTAAAQAAQPVSYSATTELTVGTPDTIAKAVVATTGALGVAIVSALADGHVTVWEIVLGVLTAIGAGAATWAVSNKP